MSDVSTAVLAYDEGGFSVAGVGIDWVTFTTRSGPVVGRLVALCDEVAEALMSQRGHTSGVKSLLGYEGVAVGPLFYGERLDGGMLRASGSIAEHVYGLLVEQAIPGNVSRLDLQVTVKWANDRANLANEAAYGIPENMPDRAKGRPPSIQLLSGFGGGDTLTIGKRDGQRFLRMYDKTREQGGEVEPNLWRYEVEYKPPLSIRVWQLLGEVSSKEQFIMSMVKSEFEQQGVLIPWDIENAVDRVKTSADLTDIQRQLRWLERQVAPCVARLIREGYRVEVMRILGLDKPDSQV